MIRVLDILHLSPPSSVHEGFPGLCKFTVLVMTVLDLSHRVGLRSCRLSRVGTPGKHKGHTERREQCRGPRVSRHGAVIRVGAASHACSLLLQDPHMKPRAVHRLCSEGGRATLSFPCVSHHQPRAPMKKKARKSAGSPVATPVTRLRVRYIWREEFAAARGSAGRAFN